MIEVAQLKDAILTIGRSLPVGMEVWFGRDDGDPRVKMEMGEPNGKVTTYAFLNSNPLPEFPLNSLLREQQLEDENKLLRAALEVSRGQWIHSVNAQQCLQALGAQPESIDDQEWA